MNRRGALLKRIKACALAALFAVLAVGCTGAPSVTDTAEPPRAEETLPETAEARFSLDAAEGGFPQNGYRHPMGEEFALSGRVSSTLPMKSLRISIRSIYNGNPAIYPQEAVMYLSASESQDADLSGLAPLVDFSVLTPGVHLLSLYAIGADGAAYPIADTRFYVVGEAWEQLTPDAFYDSYPETVAFFHNDTEKFLFRYQWVQGRYVMADPDWEEACITYRDAYPAGSRWSMHTEAVPQFTQAIGFLQNAHVRVSGTNGDSGILPLSALVKSYNGCFVSRFTSSLQYISHHSFGTAIDLNADMAPNLNTAENKALIASEVGDQLTYDGIFEEDGVFYYGFTYHGNYAEEYLGVPESVINYLLYELAFYRSGFTWAHYYAASSDGMHFALTEYVTGDHNDAGGLRKVYEYISDTQ